MRPSLLALLAPCLLLILLTGIAPAQPNETIRDCEPEPLTTEVVYGDLLRCSIGAGADTDKFQFQGRAGERIQVVVSESPLQEGVEPRLELLSPTGVTLFTDSKFDAVAARLKLREDGVHSILVRADRGTDAFDYSLAIDRLAPRSTTTPFICFGCVQSGSIEIEADFDAFTFEAKSGDFVELTLAESPVVPESQLRLELLNSNGASLFNEIDFDALSQRLLLDEDDAYTIVVSEVSRTRTFNYNVDLQCLAGPCLLDANNCQLTQSGSDVALVGGGVVVRGTLVAFGYSVVNHGEAPAGNLRLTNVIPPGAALQAVSPECLVDGRNISCEIDNLVPGEIFSFFVSVLASTGRLQNSARIELPGGCDPNQANDELILTYDPDPGSPIFEQELLFPDIVDGISDAAQFRTEVHLSNAAEPTSVEVDFHGSPDGQPMPVSLETFGRNSSFSFVLRQWESITLRSTGTDALRAGYARVRASEGVAGILTFRRSDPSTGVELSETSVPASPLLKDFHLFVDSLGDGDTALAVVVPADASAPGATLTVRLYNQSAILIAEKQLEPLPAGSHFARFIYELFSDLQTRTIAQEFEGILTVSSDQEVAAVTLRQKDSDLKIFPEEVPLLTAFAVIPGRPDQDQ